jgi:putative ABC transport system permease protein
VRFRERSRTLARLAAFTTADRVLGTGAEPAVVSTAAVSAEMLGLSIDGPLLGRVLTVEEETQQAALAVLSHGAWQRRFGGDPGIVGRTVQLDAEPFAVVWRDDEGLPSAIPRRRDLDAARQPYVRAG